MEEIASLSVSSLVREDAYVEQFDEHFLHYDKTTEYCEGTKERMRSSICWDL